MPKMTSEMKLVPVRKLVPYVNNARTHSPEQIMKLRSSLREFGFVNPVIIDRDFNVKIPTCTWYLIFHTFVIDFDKNG